MRSKILYFSLIAILVACSSSKKISLINLASHYNNWDFTSIESTVFIKQDNTAEVYLGFNLNDLIYDKQNENSNYAANYSIHYDLFNSYEAKKVLDSATYYFSDSSFYGFDRIQIQKIIIDYPLEQEYVIQVILEDINGAQLMEHYIQIESDDSYGNNDFILLSHDSVPLLNCIIDATQLFHIRVNDPEIKSLRVRYYYRDFPIAIPPFWNDPPPNYNYNADSIFDVVLSDGWSGGLSFPEPGIYQFQVDTNARKGKTVFRFYEGFPEISSAKTMLEPLRYISTEEEYNTLKEQVDLKVAVERFWLDNAGNPMRARNMIKKYYSRVAEANKLFTSYLVGWKTDRGLLYVIFGPPKIVYRANFYEEWIYGEVGHSNSIKFQFFQVDNPFTDNDFTLYRMPSYKERWYNVVSSWRR